jgi:hypothetical protein
MTYRIIAFLALVIAAPAASIAQPTPAATAPAAMATAAPTPRPMPDASETKFVDQIRADLTKRFPTAADAERAGYLRFGDEDDTGAISYANRQWTSADAAHPSQLWYDVNGRLIGADFSVPKTATKPSLWGVSPDRWDSFGLHIHYGLAGPNGTTVYHGMSAKRYAAAGGNPQHPDAAGLVKAGAAKSADEVKFVFTFPAIWDLEVWVLPNPAGAFADKNPNVTPSKSAGGMSM